MLYQLSYVPLSIELRLAVGTGLHSTFPAPRVGVPGFEPGTSALSELRSSQLSYTPMTSDCVSKPTKHKSQTDSVWLSSGNRYPGESYLSSRDWRIVDSGIRRAIGKAPGLVNG